MKKDVTFELRTEFITLDALLKAAALASSGGAAKQMILEGVVKVDGEVETRRGRKLRAGQRITLAGQPAGIRLHALTHAPGISDAPALPSVADSPDGGVS